MTTDELRSLAEGQDKETLIAFLVKEMKAGTSVDVHLRIAFSDDWFDEDRYASKQRWMALVLANSITVDEDGERVLNTFAERALVDFYQEVAIATAFGRFKEAIALLLIADEEISALVDYGVDPIPLQEEVDDRFLAITDIGSGSNALSSFNTSWRAASPVNTRYAWPSGSPIPMNSAGRCVLELSTIPMERRLHSNYCSSTASGSSRRRFSSSGM